MSPCFICHEESEIQKNHQKDSSTVTCKLCGKYEITESAIASVNHIMVTYGTDKIEESKTKLSHFIRQAQNSLPQLDTINIKKILEIKLPTPKEQVDLFIRWLGNKTQLAEHIDVTPKFDRSITGAITDSAFEMILDYIKKIELINTTPINFDVLTRTPRKISTQLTLQGWDYFHQLTIGKTEYRKAFMAMKFGDSTLDHVLETIFKPCIKDAGFELRKLNDIPVAGLIDDRLRVEIQSSDFIIADLTHDNLGAYWEAGYAEGLGKPVIYTCEKSKFENSKTHFDTNHHLTVVWDKDNPLEAGDLLKATIRATLPHLAKMNDN